jgi:hypothetical protein
MSQVVIGMDPHKRSATIEVMTSDEAVLGGGRYDTSPSGYRAMRRAVRCWPERTRATGGCQGIGRHLANRLLADGEHVVDVPVPLENRNSAGDLQVLCASDGVRVLVDQAVHDGFSADLLCRLRSRCRGERHVRRQGRAV